MSNEQERAAFETWAGDQGFPLTKLETSDGYLDLRTQGTWEAWQAASAGKTELLEALKAIEQEASTAAVSLMQWIKEAGDCDHSVGICFCDDWRKVERLSEALHKAQEAIRKATESTKEQ